MKFRVVLQLWLFVSVGLGSWTSEACSTFAIPRSAEKIVAKSFDWFDGHGLLVVNKRNVQKRALVRDLKSAHQWTSRYGSVSFHQFGREFPMSGMNETGLVVEIMWLDGTEYPKVDDRKALNELQWIQYLLDTASTLKEAIRQAKAIRVEEAAAPVHYLVCDSRGDCGAFEYLSGKLVVTQEDDLVSPVLTNNTYEYCARQLKKFVGFGGEHEIIETSLEDFGPNLPPVIDRSSIGRFVLASQLALNRFVPGKNEVDQAFQFLEKIRQGRFSVWNLVYETVSKRVHFSVRKWETRKSLEFKDLDFDCKKPVRVYDMKSSDSGDIGQKLVPYTSALNQANLDQNERIQNPELFARASQYPETTRCLD